MILYPAIDLYGGRVVRLFKGDFSKKTEYGEDPGQVAQRLVDAGARWLHVVDLEGAEQGCPIHLETLKQISSLGVPIQFGGGLRSEEAIARSVDAGATRAMVGSLLTKTPEAPSRLFELFGEALLPAVDVKDGKVAVSGWKETVDLDPAPFLKTLCETGFRHFLVTAVSRDGTGTGPDLDLYGALTRIAGAHLIAAGGISSRKDLENLRERGLAGAVVGKALYNGSLNPETIFREMDQDAD